MPDPRRPLEIVIDPRPGRAARSRAWATTSGCSCSTVPTPTGSSRRAPRSRRTPGGGRPRVSWARRSPSGSSGVGVDARPDRGRRGLRESLRSSSAPRSATAYPDFPSPYWGEVVRLRRGAADIPAFRRAVARLAPGEAVAFQTMPGDRGQGRARGEAPGRRPARCSRWSWRSPGSSSSGRRWPGRASSTAPTTRRCARSVRRACSCSPSGCCAPCGRRRRRRAARGGRSRWRRRRSRPSASARNAEPDPGFRIDGPILVLGALAVIGVVLLLAAVPAWRHARARTGGRRRRRRLVSARGRLRIAPAPRSPLGAGVRMALEPGRGRTAVPVRATVAQHRARDRDGRGRDRVRRQPRPPGRHAAALRVELGRRHRRVGVGRGRSASALHDESSPKLLDRSSTVTGLDRCGAQRDQGRRHCRCPRSVSSPGRVGCADGRRAGASPDATTRSRSACDRSTASGVGDRRPGPGRVAVDGGHREMRGRGPHRAARPRDLPGSGQDVARRRRSASPTTRCAALGPEFGNANVFVRFTSAAAAARMSDQAPGHRRTGPGRDGDLVVNPARRTSDVLAYERVRTLPLLLAGFLALLAAATVAHALVTSGAPSPPRTSRC